MSLSTDYLPLSPRAIEGFQRRRLTKLRNKKVQRCCLQSKSQRALLTLRQAEAIPLAGRFLRQPDDPRSQWITIGTARYLYQKKLVYFASRMDTAVLFLTDKGREIAAALWEMERKRPILGMGRK